MKKPIISVIVAVAKKDRAIGFQNKLLWNIPEDLKNFKDITKGHPVIMGQKTYESMGRLLPGRTNVILTFDKELSIDEAVICYDINQAIIEASKIDQEEIFFIGGGQIYKQSLPLASRLYVTEVEGEFEADSFFPDYAEFKKEISSRVSHDDNHEYIFKVLER